MAKKAFVYNGTQWVDIAQSTTDLSNYYTKSQSDAITPPGAWTSYTPTISGGWAAGNGTWSATYTQIGKTVHFSAKFTIGSTTTKGTGFTASLPVQMAINNNQQYSGVGIIGSSVYRLFFEAVGGSTTALTGYLGYASAAPGYLGRAAITATVPLTWATGDTISFNGTYEAA